MAGPLLGMMRQMGGAMFGAQAGQALGALAGEVVGSTDVGLPLGPGRARPRCCRGLDGFGAGLDVDAGRGPALPGAARGRPPAAVRARAVAARAPARRGRGVRQRHHRRHCAQLEEAVGQHRPRPTPSRCRRRWAARAVPAARTPRSRRPRWPGWRRRSRWSRAGSTRWSTRRPRRACRAGRAARGDAAPAGHRRPGRADVRDAGRPGAAAAPAARGRARCGPRSPRRAASTAATRCGRTRTCCRPPTTSTTRTASCTAEPDLDFDAIQTRLFRRGRGRQSKIGQGAKGTHRTDQGRRRQGQSPLVDQPARMGSGTTFLHTDAACGHQRTMTTGTPHHSNGDHAARALTSLDPGRQQGEEPAAGATTWPSLAGPPRRPTGVLPARAHHGQRRRGRPGLARAGAADPAPQGQDYHWSPAATASRARMRTLGAAALREAHRGVRVKRDSRTAGSLDGEPVPVRLNRHQVRCTGKDRPENTPPGRPVRRAGLARRRGD